MLNKFVKKELLDYHSFRPIKSIPKFPVDCFPSAAFLCDENSLPNLYKEFDRLCSKLGDIPELNDVFSYSKDSIVSRTNPFGLILFDKILRGYGIHLAGPEDIQKVSEIYRNSLRNKSGIERHLTISLNNYTIETALMLRTQTRAKSLIGQDLISQILSRGIPEGNFPIIAPYNCLDVEKAKIPPFRLKFVLRDDSKLISAKSFVKRNYNKRVYIDNNKTGVQEDSNSWLRKGFTLLWGPHSTSNDISRLSTNSGASWIFTDDLVDTRCFYPLTGILIVKPGNADYKILEDYFLEINKVFKVEP